MRDERWGMTLKVQLKESRKGKDEKSVCEILEMLSE